MPRKRPGTRCRWCSCRHRPTAGPRFARRWDGASVTGPRARQRRRSAGTTASWPSGDGSCLPPWRLPRPSRFASPRRASGSSTSTVAHLARGVGRAERLGDRARTQRRSRSLRPLSSGPSAGSMRSIGIAGSDEARGDRERVRGGNADRRCPGCPPAGAGRPCRLPGGGIGAATDRKQCRSGAVSAATARIDQRQVGPAQQHRCRGETVGRERGGHGARTTVDEDHGYSPGVRTS